MSNRGVAIRQLGDWLEYRDTWEEGDRGETGVSGWNSGDCGT